MSGTVEITRKRRGGGNNAWPLRARLICSLSIPNCDTVFVFLVLTLFSYTTSFLCLSDRLTSACLKLWIFFVLLFGFVVFGLNNLTRTRFCPHLLYVTLLLIRVRSYRIHHIKTDRMTHIKTLRAVYGGS